MLWLHKLWGEMPTFLNTAASLVAVLGAVKVRAWWRGRGPGRRHRLQSSFSQVALQVRADHVVALFGEPTYRQERTGWRFKVGGDPLKAEREDISYTERLWLLAGDAYLQILTDEHDNVVRYWLTSRSRKFCPRIPIGAVEGGSPTFFVRLGRTLFSELPPEPDRIYRGPYGATAPYEFRQSYYGARPGGYADWTCSYNAAGLGPVAFLSNAIAVPPWEQAMSGRGWLANLTENELSELAHSRQGTVVNTVTVEHSRSDRSGTIGYGPDRELVRLIPVRASGWHRLVRRVRRSAIA
jgi:hypothetical protein